MHEVQEMQVRSLGQEDLLEKETVTQSSILPRKSYRQRSFMGYSSWGLKELDVTENACVNCFQVLCKFSF